MHNFLVWLGWSVDNTFCTPVANTFWHSPLGLACTLSLLITSAIRVMHKKSNAGFGDTLWHFLFATVAAAGFTIGATGQVPHQLVKSLLILIAVRGVIKAWRVIKGS
jgi:steroid 5-alpha reductase family enzyme